MGALLSLLTAPLAIIASRLMKDRVSPAPRRGSSAASPAQPEGGEDGEDAGEDTERIDIVFAEAHAERVASLSVSGTCRARRLRNLSTHNAVQGVANHCTRFPPLCHAACAGRDSADIAAGAAEGTAPRSRTRDEEL